MTCITPKRWPTRTTHDRILRAIGTGSGTDSELAEARVAGGALARRVDVAEVGREMAVTAADAGGVALHLLQQRPRGVGELAVLLEHHLPAHEVAAELMSTHSASSPSRPARPDSCW